MYKQPLHLRPPPGLSTSRTLTASEAGAPGGQGPGLSPSCRRALSWVKCPASFMSGLAPPHSASTSSRIAMVTASSLMDTGGLELKYRSQTLPRPTALPAAEEGTQASAPHWPPSTPVPFAVTPTSARSSREVGTLSCRPPQRPPLPACAFAAASTTTVSWAGGQQPPPQRGLEPGGLRGRFNNRAGRGHCPGKGDWENSPTIPRTPQPQHTVSTAEGHSLPLSHRSPSPGSARSLPAPHRPSPRPCCRSSPAPGTREATAKVGRAQGRCPAPPPGPALTAERRAARPAGPPGAGLGEGRRGGRGVRGRGSNLKGP